MAPRGVGSGGAVACGSGARIVRGGRVAQRAGGAVRGVGSQGVAALGESVGYGAAAGRGGSAASRLRAAGGRVATGIDRVLWQPGGVGRGAAAGGGHGLGSAAVCAAAGVGASARPVAGAGLSSDVSGGVGSGSCGGVELRVGAVAVGSSRRAPGLGRAHAGFSHRVRCCPTTAFCCCPGFGFRTWRRTCWGAWWVVWRRIGRRVTGFGRCWWRRAWSRLVRRRATVRRAGRAWVGRRVGPAGGRRRRSSRRGCGCGAWHRVGRRRCGGRRRGSRVRFRPCLWRKRRVGRGASLRARTWPTGACGGDWSGWAGPGSGILANRWPAVFPGSAEQQGGVSFPAQ